MKPEQRDTEPMPDPDEAPTLRMERASVPSVAIDAAEAIEACERASERALRIREGRKP